ncbi:MAG: response regulator, partial [Planctomycetaceae bacterium]|nr:response regulator [Planctomycetaceae bacterium]
HAIHLVVQDTGVGIAKEHQEAIFQAFNQASTSVTRQYGGTGLGLSISTELVALMQGSLWVESELGVGSSFHVVVPLATFDDGNGPKGALPPRPPGCALLVSENSSASAAYTEMLGECGVSVTTASNAEEAQLAWVEAAAHNRPIIILILDARADADIEPRWLVDFRTMIGDADCPLVLLTPVDQMESAGQFREWGADHILMKPVTSADFQHLLSECATMTPESSPTCRRTTCNVPTREEAPVALAAVSLRVLVADDSAVNREVASGLLEFLGHDVETARNGREAVELVQSSEFDVVFMDIEMPEMNGYDATRAIREREALSGRRLPIIAMSAHAAEELMKSGRDAGMDHHVSKPIDPAQIKYVLEHLDEFVQHESVH